jgi:hypothetical protein
MNLCIYAIKVGKTTIEKLKVNKELDMENSVFTKDNPSYREEEPVEKVDTANRLLDVYDVLFAGVESND